MHDRVRHKLFLFFFLSVLSLSAQEICNNGLDDDGDDLVDINDPDCMCTSYIASSLIQNPSFEERSCCPTRNEMLDCADGWIQASAPTTDYVHVCGGFLGNTSIPAFAPQPFPDGQGAVGFRDGQSSAGPSYKEYVGACLTEPMEIGVTYRFDFYVGFRDNVIGSTDFEIAFFGSTSCDDLPFGGNNTRIGCPVNTGNYTQLQSQRVSGSNEWINIIVEFVADQAYEVLVLGPSCADNSNYIFDPYFYVDGLNLAEIGAFGTALEDISGSICADDLRLTVAAEVGNSYQWYRDGVALIGETDPSLELGASTDLEGSYLVAITTDDGCSLSKAYDLRIPPYFNPIFHEICENENLTIGDSVVFEAGYYEITIPAADGCDSILQLTLDVIPASGSMIFDTICPGDVYRLHDIETSTTGIYQTALQNQANCDSIITLDLYALPSNNGIELPSLIELKLGEIIDIEPEFFDPRLIHFTWYDIENNALGSTRILEGFIARNDTEISIEAMDGFGCISRDTVSVRVDKSNLSIELPSAFSPNGDNNNDYFRHFGSAIVDHIRSFQIFDRWGNLVFNTSNITEDTMFTGWDGKFNGSPALVGVYVYKLDVVFVDGSSDLIHGNLSLIR